MIRSKTQYDVGEKPTVILYTYMQGHQTKNKKTKTSLNRVVIVYDNSAIEPYCTSIEAYNSLNTMNIIIL